MDEEKKFNYNQTGLEDRERPTVEDTQLDLEEEFASEIATNDDVAVEPSNLEDEIDDPDLKNVYGWVGLALSVISFFIIPALFAAIGIVLGFIARRGEAKILGNTAIIVGIVSILFRLFMLPLF